MTKKADVKEIKTKGNGFIQQKFLRFTTCMNAYVNSVQKKSFNQEYKYLSCDPNSFMRLISRPLHIKTEEECYELGDTKDSKRVNS